MKKLLVFAALLALIGGGWYAFRPELLFIDQQVHETLPPAGAQAMQKELAKGMFRSLAHETKGQATVYQLDGGRRILRLSDFATSNGPDVHVYLVAAAEAPDDATVKNAGFVDLGSLKGNLGDQNYEIPADVDLGKFRAVSIWCARFGVNFGSSPLNPASPG